MINEGELPTICANDVKGDTSKMITVQRKDFGPNIEAFVVTGIKGCCMSAKKCAMWIYKKDTGGVFWKVYGIDSPDNIIPVKTGLHNGMYDIEVMDSFGQRNTFYEFDGNKYKFIREDYYGK